MEEKFDYFIEQTNKRFDDLDRKNAQHFDKIYEKLESLISFRLMLVGASMAIATICSIVVTLITLALK